MSTITKLLNKYIQYLIHEKEEMDDIINYPLNTKKATIAEITKTEEKLSCTIPDELKNYYLNEANGSEDNMEEYLIDKWHLDVFSHQKIMGIFDYYKLYWKELGGADLDTVLNNPTEDEISFYEQKNKEFFVCIVDWSENYIGTFVFDKNANFYQFAFDQDHLLDVYIDRMEKGSEIMKKDKSLAKLLEEYLENFM